MGHGVEESGQEKRRPRSSDEIGALGEHLSDRDEQMGLQRK